MHQRHVAALLLLPLAAACASGPGGGPAPDAALAYTGLAGSTATYVQGDTVEIQIDAGGQFLEVSVDSYSVLDVAFADAAPGVEVTATYREFDVAATNPMMGTQRADEDEIEGPVVWTLTPTGEGTLVSAPEIGGTAAQVVSPTAIAGSFFMPLPGRPVAPGDSWVDTVSIVGEEEVGEFDAESIYTFTAAGDTVVDGRALTKVTFVSEEERLSSSMQQGTEVTQDVGGEGEGWYLWDPARNLIVAQYYEGRLEGSMTVPMAPMPLGMDMIVVSHLRLDDGGGS
jgi:hypothetical protein